MNKEAMVHNKTAFDQFDFFYKMKNAYIKSYFGPNIVSSFIKTGTVTIDASRVLLSVFFVSFKNAAKTRSFAEME